MVIRVIFDLMVIFWLAEKIRKDFSSNFPSKSPQTAVGKRLNNITATAAAVCYESRYGVCCAGSFDLCLRRKK
jgi:hypothetical protein